MQISSPMWRLNLQCPCCGQGQPLLVACHTCGRVAAECEEVGTFFPDPVHLNSAGSTQCSGCGAAGIDAFVVASDTQVQNAGFKLGQYV